ncbi:MAG: 2-oxoglutarate dehydrogenase complex dihydrolipoyllysine-residue succinyltransferase [Gammaproteobacteria bacterium]|nr:2-oxoglutarate dehydrogenase complex dihydrolipoyllysine-residue succinyltransferase [Gammaproteobacteria bacterium]
MTIEVKVPTLPESVADAVVLAWHKKPGDTVRRDESLVDVETDKVVLEVPAPADGVLSEIKQQEGSTVVSDQLLAIMQAGKVAEKADSVENKIEKKENNNSVEVVISPSAKKMMVENNISEKELSGSGRDGRILKEDVIKYLSDNRDHNKTDSVSTVTAKPVVSGEGRIEKRVPMTRLRARIAERLVEAQQTAAILTTFNEVNMKPVMDLRKKYQDKFEKEYQVRLGFMSFFIKAAIEALKQFPAVNASIDGNDIVYHGYFDIGVAVSSPRGLVVPVVRDAEQMNLADIERTINDYVEKAKGNTIAMEDMMGGTFTISNGGVFGSLLSTPILNPPQSAILGMHKIQDRPVVENGEIVIRPMMYLALSYDHRIIDGKEAVQFLVTIKDCLEDPARMIIGV